MIVGVIRLEQSSLVLEMERQTAVPEFGEKKRDAVRLKGSGEDYDAPSVEALFKEVWLTEWNSCTPNSV